jgi:hypothetical protein
VGLFWNKREVRVVVWLGCYVVCNYLSYTKLAAKCVKAFGLLWCIHNFLTRTYHYIVLQVR